MSRHDFLSRDSPENRRSFLYYQRFSNEHRLIGGLPFTSPSFRSAGRSKLFTLSVFFGLGFLSGCFFMLTFDSIKPCGKSLGNTLLNVIANVTSITWDISKSKYVIQCPDHPPDFVGKLPFPLEKMPSFDELNKMYASTFKKDAAIGGHYKPEWCRATSRVAIIVPYRNREDNLKGFLYYLHQIMQRQLLDYAIYVVEQTGSEKVRFNRGVLLNVGFIEALKAYDFDCVIFYDVDKVPEDDRNSHACPRIGYVRHMAAYQHRFERMAFRDEYFGGVLAMTSHDVKAINGFSNVFFGYGYEDDEFLKRIKLQNLTIYREHPLHTKYWNLGHEGDGVLWSEFDWKHENAKLLDSTAQRMYHDGLNSVAYESISVKILPTYTKVVVEISEENILKRLHKQNPAIFKIVQTIFNIDESNFKLQS